ncbi:MAG: GNAT family N-acetyltransferase [Hyphomicrobiaceae bacterium]|nr:GNAT family N-acetyltransferase [Hyphomicrobiaceae bacterium]
MRLGKTSDAKALARIFKESWFFAYRGILPEQHLDALAKQRTPEWWRRFIKGEEEGLLVLELDGTVAGYATFGPSRHAGRHQGEIYELYLDPLYQGLGLGEHLFEGCRARLDERGLDGLVVWALIENTPACDFYWRRGGRPIKSTQTRIAGAQLEKVAFGWR